jgi:hypothetical protein
MGASVKRADKKTPKGESKMSEQNAVTENAGTGNGVASMLPDGFILREVSRKIGGRKVKGTEEVAPVIEWTVSVPVAENLNGWLGMAHKLYPAAPDAQDALCTALNSLQVSGAIKGDKGQVKKSTDRAVTLAEIASNARGFGLFGRLAERIAKRAGRKGKYAGGKTAKEAKDTGAQILTIANSTNAEAAADAIAALRTQLGEEGFAKFQEMLRA